MILARALLAKRCEGSGDGAHGVRRDEAGAARALAACLSASALFSPLALAGGSSWNARGPLIGGGARGDTGPPVGVGVCAAAPWGAAWPCLALLPLAMRPYPCCSRSRFPPAVWLGMPAQQPRFTALVLSGLDLAASRSASIPAPRSPRFRPAAARRPDARHLCLDGGAPAHSRRRVDLAALAGLVLGLAQLAQPRADGPISMRRPTQGYLVGWFANRNHEAALLLALTPLAAALVAGPVDAVGWRALPAPGPGGAGGEPVARGRVYGRAGVVW